MKKRNMKLVENIHVNDGKSDYQKRYNDYRGKIGMV